MLDYQIKASVAHVAVIVYACVFDVLITYENLDNVEVELVDTVICKFFSQHFIQMYNPAPRSPLYLDPHTGGSYIAAYFLAQDTTVSIPSFLESDRFQN